MKSLAGLRGVIVTVILLAAVLSVLWAFISQGITAVIVPPPETVGEDLLRALAAHRYEGARQVISSELQQVTEEDLGHLMQRIEAAHRGIEQVHGESSTQQQQTATAQIIVQFSDGSQQTIELPLQQKYGLWKVTSLEALNALTK